MPGAAVAVSARLAAGSGAAVVRLGYPDRRGRGCGGVGGSAVAAAAAAAGSAAAAAAARLAATSDTSAAGASAAIESAGGVPAIGGAVSGITRQAGCVCAAVIRYCVQCSSSAFCAPVVICQCPYESTRKTNSCTFRREQEALGHETRSLAIAKKNNAYAGGSAGETRRLRQRAGTGEASSAAAATASTGAAKSAEAAAASHAGAAAWPATAADVDAVGTPGGGRNGSLDIDAERLLRQVTGEAGNAVGEATSVGGGGQAVAG